MSSVHVPVMLEDSMLALEIRPDGLYVDGTLGGASHSEELLKRSAPDGKVFSFDVSRKALEAAASKLAPYGKRWTPVEANFRHMDRELIELGVPEGSVDGILLDLGFSSDEIQDPAIGLSFQNDGPLDMRLGPKANEDGLTASDIVNTWPEREIETMIRNFGEERFASRIASAIVQARKAARIVRTLELVSIIRGAVPAGYEQGRIHPATRTFQALRIAVNDELEALKDAIKAAHRMLKPEGRIAIITFHSLEDRIAKLAFKGEGEWEQVTKKPMVPSDQEQNVNPRSRSAKMRIAQKK
ncbi:16S rRNA (cytosine(1402)-N(4))-methyltransferase RsmH [Patescibacteria group bacterium]|jgi:16S rRNA (cytosine1402-N4)-methyltransferase|nr:16S rRNA (cytosine(1402)-N(4))-methyltransferase RsmH [Patescibacteria group bacterium]